MDSDNQISSKPIKLPPQLIGGIPVSRPRFLFIDGKLVNYEKLKGRIRISGIDDPDIESEHDEKGHTVIKK